MELFIRHALDLTTLKIINYDATHYVILPITSSDFLFLCLLVYTLSSQLSLKPIQFMFFNGVSSYGVYRVQISN